MTPLAKARADYIDAVKNTEKRKHSFTVRARQCHVARAKYLLHPTKANRNAFHKAKATRALRLRAYRRARDHRNDLKAEYERLKKAANQPLRLRALVEARHLIGVMESGGNNSGADVAKIIRGGGGNPSERPPWCGYFDAYTYRLAGSKAVDWHWAAVRLLSAVSGVKRTTKPLPGDIVRFTFDHTGLFEKDNGDGTITTIEGNTGASGAVSDSKTGGDGVYRKIRSKSLVQDYLHVTR